MLPGVPKLLRGLIGRLLSWFGKVLKPESGLKFFGGGHLSEEGASITPKYPPQMDVPKYRILERVTNIRFDPSIAFGHRAGIQFSNSLVHLFF